MPPDAGPRFELEAYAGRLKRVIVARLRNQPPAAANPGGRIAQAVPDAGTGADCQGRAARLLRGIAPRLVVARLRNRPPAAANPGGRIAQAAPDAGTGADCQGRAARLLRGIAPRLPGLPSTRRRRRGSGALADIQRILLQWRPGRTIASPAARLSRRDLSPAHRLCVTTVFSVVTHLVLVLGVTFAHEDHPDRRVEALDVLLVPYRSEPAPARPDYLARASRDGGGTGLETGRPSPAPPPIVTSGPSIDTGGRSTQPHAPRLSDAGAPAGAVPPWPSTPASGIATPSGESAAAETALLEADADDPIIVEPTRPARTRAPIETLAAAQSLPEEAGDAPQAPLEYLPGRTTASVQAPAGDPGPRRESGSAARSRRSAEMAALAAELERKAKAYAERPRRKWISARTREHEFAAYMDAWRRKVERVGNLNYPDESVRRGLSGNLLLEVALRPDGTVESITLRRSSGERVLDDAAVHIVELAAPFSRFPKSIADHVDVLHVVRTWIFRPDDHPPSP